ncbi:HVO_2753 family zinc finger protein [Methanothrix harundinacea]|jgi:hypothetical protein|uniref:HVO_2753 family zinc finger protein n=1 Tax=Methanothrix harundinacea TaxID=301375 RepID=UPI0009D9D16D|nr:HVO_2753 family zinc finger protein [Methanothrix harundinacea]
MTEKSERCMSCGVTLIGPGGARFPCPNCGEIIIRCNKCRKQSNPYTCPSCGFLGP